MDLLDPTTYTALTVTTGAAVGVTSALETSGVRQRAWFRIEGGTVRFRDDGTNPTTSVGFPLFDQETLEYDGNVGAVKFIAATTTVTVHVLLYVPD